MPIKSLFALPIAIFPATSYEKKKDGEQCPIHRRIKTESECKSAADELGWVWGHTWFGPLDVPGCIFANDGRSKVFFNVAADATGSNPQYAEICTTTTDTGEIF